MGAICCTMVLVQMYKKRDRFPEFWKNVESDACLMHNIFFEKKSLLDEYFEVPPFYDGGN